MTKEEKDVLETETTETLSELDTIIEDAAAELEVEDNTLENDTQEALVEDNYSFSNPFMYSTETTKTEEPEFTYNEENTNVIEETQDAFKYVETEEVKDNTTDVPNVFAYGTESFPQDNAVSNDFTYVDYTNNQVAQQDNTSFEYSEATPVVEEKKEQNPTIYEPNVKFSTEDEIRNNDKGNFTFMLIFALIMIAAIIALPYFAKI